MRARLDDFSSIICSQDNADVNRRHRHTRQAEVKSHGNTADREIENLRYLYLDRSSSSRLKSVHSWRVYDIFAGGWTCQDLFSSLPRFP